jgi:hypothetical protein
MVQTVAEQVLAKHVTVKFCSTPHHLGSASYGPSGELVFNKFRLGAEWFEREITEDVTRALRQHQHLDPCTPGLRPLKPFTVEILTTPQVFGRAMLSTLVFNFTHSTTTS